MRLEAADPDIETICTRIERGDIDLQPEFQRGEVWGRAKKQRLIDSILRGWHVPPIHVIELAGTRKQEVLDGQQRLTAIRDFVRGDFPVDGQIAPNESGIVELNGKKFRELPDPWKRRFNQFTIRVFRIVDYKPEEPGELFFRLNQPTSLTSAEQRNAFFGPVRAQIKSLVDFLDLSGIDKELLGFSNSRMAYDDIVARVALTVERNTITEKVTAGDLIALYREDKPLDSRTVERISDAIRLFGLARAEIIGHAQFNKATVYSWFLFIIKGLAVGGPCLSESLLGKFLASFQETRLSVDLVGDVNDDNGADTYPHRLQLLGIYDNRSASRVADVSSVVLRDIVIWLEFEMFVKKLGYSTFPILNVGLERIHQSVSGVGSPFVDDVLARLVIKSGWGKLL